MLLLTRSHLARLGGLISGVRLYALRIQKRSRMIPALKKPRERLSCSENPEPWEIDMEGTSIWVMWAKPYRRVILRHPRIQDVGPRSSLNLDRFMEPPSPGPQPSGFAYWTGRPLQLAPGHIIPRSGAIEHSFSLMTNLPSQNPLWTWARYPRS